MDAFFNGPLGQIAGIALEKLRNSPRLSESDKIRTQYDAIEAHFQGVSRILKPAINLLIESKSADRSKSESHSSTSPNNINYYTPQKGNNFCPCNKIDQNNLPKENRFRNEKFSESRKVPWRTCDACQTVSKFLIPTSCEHEICQKCVKNGNDCQKCLKSVKNIKREKL